MNDTFVVKTVVKKGEQQKSLVSDGPLFHWKCPPKWRRGKLSPSGTATALCSFGSSWSASVRSVKFVPFSGALPPFVTLLRGCFSTFSVTSGRFWHFTYSTAPKIFQLQARIHGTHHSLWATGSFRTLAVTWLWFWFSKETGHLWRKRSKTWTALFQNFTPSAGGPFSCASSTSSSRWDLQYN